MLERSIPKKSIDNFINVNSSKIFSPEISLAKEVNDNNLSAETLKEIKNSLGNDINLRLSEFLSKSRIPKNKKELLFYVFPFNTKKLGKVATNEEINYMHEHYKLMSSYQDNIYEALINSNRNHEHDKNLVGVYLQLLKEDRVDLFPLYLSLFYFNENSNQIVKKILRVKNINLF